MIFEYIKVFSEVRSREQFRADDLADKMNRFLTVIILIISILIISARSLVGPTIVCLDDPYRKVPIKLEYVQQVW